ncbi:recombinase family protein [Streptomyces lydicus]|uniref:recombinase family protein n=1 Tax=Streptomyces lydicus TaxID=47763 RepID=UPI0037158B5B
MRPEFRQLLADLANGVIDGVVFYDLDRLVRQPRDLEDLIDIVEYVKPPVTGATGGRMNLIFQDFMSRESAYSIARSFNAEGIQPPAARAWSSTMVAKMLRNPRYAGMVSYAGKHRVQAATAGEAGLDAYRTGLVHDRALDLYRSIPVQHHAERTVRELRDALAT